MKDIHPVRGVLWILLAMVLSSIKAEGVINGSLNHNDSVKELQSISFEDLSSWKIASSGTCYQKTPNSSYNHLVKASLPSKEAQPRSPQIKVIASSIEDNLYNSGIRAGLPPNIILDLTDIFSSYVDFTTDLRNGDTFSVVLGKVEQNSKLPKWKILAAKITVQGETFEAFFFQPPGQKGAYYDAKGRSTSRAFLKAPLQYRRISSVFTKKRFHPILRIYRPHFGIDYAAPVGTPVSAIGAGKVVFVGRKGGFGNYVEIKHNGIYSSSYGHLSRFARGIRVGKYVEQGEIIGYVGKTGLATGPHLDFRFYANGRPVNFMAVANSIAAEPMAKSLDKKFQTMVEYYRSLMGQKEPKKVAGMRSYTETR